MLTASGSISLDPLARFVWPPHGDAARAVGYRIGPNAREYKAHRRSLGCCWPLPSGKFHRRQLERMERTISRRCPKLLPWREGWLTRFADRILGSPEIYAHKQREMEQSVNFVTCHDGFTLNDLVSYDQKHNEANLEDNRDGSNDNRSWNCGAEGPTEDPAVEPPAESTGKELFHDNHAFTGHADDSHGRRDAAYPGWQQQRLLL